MWSFLSNRGPVTVSHSSTNNNNHHLAGSTKIAGFHVSNFGRDLLDLASNPCHKPFPDFINRSNSASELVSDTYHKQFPEQVANLINRSKSASELSTTGTDSNNCGSSMGGKSDAISPSRAPLAPAEPEKPASPSPKKRRRNLQNQQQEQQEPQSVSMVVPIEGRNDDDDDDEEEEENEVEEVEGEDSSGDEDMVPLRVRERSDSVTSEDSFIVFMDSENDDDKSEPDQNEEELDDNKEEDEDSDMDLDSDSESDSDSSSDDDDICFKVTLDRCTSCVPTTTKRVHWAPDDKLCSVRHMLTWKIAHWKARMGPWMTMAIDRMHFQHKIATNEPVLNKVLGSKHRARIYEERFQNQE